MGFLLSVRYTGFIQGVNLVFLSEIDFFDFEPILECQKRKNCKTEQLNRRVETRKYTNKCVRICLTVKIPRISPKMGEFEPKMGELRENFQRKVVERNRKKKLPRKNTKKCYRTMISVTRILIVCLWYLSRSCSRTYAGIRGCTRQCTGVRNDLI